MAEPKLSLCIIAKDEEKNIARCIASVDGLADEIIVVDTGSRDRTAEVARELGAQVFFCPWEEDFSGPKNFALDRARGEWALLMDADDVLSREAHAEILNLTLETDVDGFLLQTVSFLGRSPGLSRVTNLQVRLVRNRPQYRYRGRIHERILSEPGSRVRAVPLKVYHYGYLDSELSGKGKLKRNLRILREAVRQEPSDFNRFNLGMEYLRTGRLGQAKAQLEQVWRHAAPEAGYFPDLVIKLASTYLELAEYEAGLSVLTKGIEQHPKFTDLFLIQGRVYQAMGEYALAARAFETCLSKGEAPFIYASELGCGSYLAWNALGDLASDLYDYKRAAGCYLESLTHAPQQAETLAALLKALGKFMGLPELRKFLRDNFNLDDASGSARLVSALLAADQPELAREILSRIDAAASDEQILSYLRGQYLLMSGCFEQAHRHLGGIAGESAFYTEAITSLCVIHWVLHAWPRAEQDLRCLQSAPGGALRGRLFRLVHVCFRWGKVGRLKLNRQESAPALSEILALLRLSLQLKQENLLQAVCRVVESVPGWGQGLIQAAQICMEYGALDSALPLLARASQKPESGSTGERDKKKAEVRKLTTLLRAQRFAAAGQWSLAWSAFQLGNADLTRDLGMIHALAGMAGSVLRNSPEPRPALAQGLSELLELFPVKKA